VLAIFAFACNILNVVIRHEKEFKSFIKFTTKEKGPKIIKFNSQIKH
jgi:hypothetical protein